MAAERSTRVRRVEKAMHEELASLLLHEVKDPGAAGVIVTRVEMPGDLRSARVYVRLLEQTELTERRSALLDALKRASGMIRREVARRLGLRHAPELAFRFDDGQEDTTRVEQLLAEIEAERGAKR